MENTGKEKWKPGNMLYPVPAVMVSCADQDIDPNIITVAWTGTICTNPPMVYISVRPERYSYDIIKNSGEFVINLPTKELTEATDWCGVKSFKKMKLTPKMGSLKKAPIIEESPLALECEVTEIIPLGSHHMFLAKIKAVWVDTKYMDEKGKFCLDEAGIITYSHGKYFELGDIIGKFGYSVKKK